MRARANCGHDGPLGYVMTGGGNAYSLCYQCAGQDERNMFLRPDTNVWAAYDTGDGRITTWTGEELARVTHSARGNWQYTPTGGQYRMRTVTARDSAGRYWRGRHSDEWQLVTLRRVTP